MRLYLDLRYTMNNSGVSGSSNILSQNIMLDCLHTNRCSPETVSTSSPYATNCNNILNLEKLNYPKVSYIPAQKLSTQTFLFQSKYKVFE